MEDGGRDPNDGRAGSSRVVPRSQLAEVKGELRKFEKDLNDLSVNGSELEHQESVSGPTGLEHQESEERRLEERPFGHLRYYHRGTAARMLRDYIKDLRSLNISIVDSVQKRVEEYEAFLKDLEEANQRELNSPLSLQERSKLMKMLLDYQAAISEALEDQEEDRDVVDGVELTVEDESIASGVPLYLSEADFSGGGYMESLTAALDVCETLVQEFRKLLPQVKIYHCMCAYLVETLSPTAGNNFHRYREVLGALQNLEVDSLVTSSSRRNSVSFCFESLVGLARRFQSVVDLLRKCSSRDWHKSALELADVRPLTPRRWSEFSLAIRNCEWTMDLVELAFHALEKLLTDGQYNVKDASFKWAEAKCRMVLQIQGARLESQNSSQEKSILEVSRELEAKDLTALIEQLEKLAESEKSQKRFYNRTTSDVCKIASFLSEKLGGPKPELGTYLPYTFRINGYSSLKYQEYLDSGSSGMVAKYTWHGVQVAVKSIRSPGLNRKMFEQEAAILAMVQHPNVVRLIGCEFIEEKRTGLLVMELMDHDLRTVIESRIEELGHGSSPFTVIVAIDIMLQIAQAMRYLREHKILHRDLKAKNILVNICKPLITSGGESNTSLMRLPVSTVLPHTQENYVAKLADFGLAKSRPQSSWVATRMAGTTGWRAPEVFNVPDTEVAQEYKWPADVYSFAMTCYEILTGSMPFENVPNHSVHGMILAGDRPSLESLEIPEALKDLINNCWATDPEQRPSFDDIVKKLWECKVKAILPVFERHITTSVSRACSLKSS